MPEPNKNVWPHIVAKFKEMFGGKPEHAKDSIDYHKEAGDPMDEIETMPIHEDNTKPSAPEHSEISHPKLQVAMAKIKSAMPDDEEDGEPAGRFAGMKTS